MTGHLLLSGGGDEKQTFHIDALLVSLLKGKKLLYIPTAMSPESFSFDECFDWLKNCLEQHNFEDIDMVTSLKGMTYSDVKDYGAIYIGGGNTFSLLKDIKQFGFDKVLIEYFKNGGVIYGGSAGAIILGHDIGTAAIGDDSDENKVGLEDLSGLNLLNGMNVACHYSAADEDLIRAYMERTGVKIIALPENCGLHVFKGEFRTEGKGVVFLS